MANAENAAQPPLPHGLRWVRVLQPWLIRLHVNYPQFCLLIATKFSLAAREKAGLSATKRKLSKHPLRVSFLFNLLIGLVLMLTMIIPMPLITSLSSYTSLLFVMFFFTMLTTYSSLILDPKDRRIFGARGVSDRTLNAARIVTVGLFMGMTMGALGLPGLVILTLQRGLLVGFAMLLSSVLLALFSLQLALLFYLLVLRFFDGERLKNALNIIQILMVIGLYLAAQLPNLIANSGLATVKLSLPTHFVWWYLPALPVWFIGLPLLAAGTVNPLSLTLTGLSLFGTIALVLVYVHWADRFEQYLEKLDQNDDTVRRPSRYLTATRRLLCHRREEATYFTLGWRLTTNEREYKLRVYPQLAYGLLLPVIMAFAFVQRMSARQAAYFVPYLGLSLAFAAPMAIINLAFSHQPEAMRIFQFVPLATPGLLLRGILKALFARLFAPLVLGLGLLGLILTGWHGLLPLVMALAFNYAAIMCFGRMMAPKTVPFASEFTPVKGMTGSAIGMVALFGGMILGFGLIFAGGLLHSPFFDLPCIALFVVIGWLVARTYPASIRYDLQA